MSTETVDPVPDIKELKIIFSINDVSIDKTKKPVKGEVDPCTDPEKIVLIWDGSYATINITSKDGTEFDFAKDGGPLAHFKNGLSYYFINKKFIPADINGLNEIVNFLHKNYIATVETNETKVVKYKKYMEAVHKIVGEILEFDKEPTDPEEKDIYNKIKTFKDKHGVFGNEFEDIGKCKLYIKELFVLFGGNVSQDPVDTYPDPGPGPGPGPGDKDKNFRAAATAVSAANRFSNLPNDGGLLNGLFDEKNHTPTPNPNPPSPYPNPVPVVPGPDKPPATVINSKGLSTVENLRASRETPLDANPSGKRQPYTGRNSSRLNGAAALPQGGSGTRRYQNKKGRFTRRYRFK